MNLTIHPKYKEHYEALVATISQFESQGQILVDGERNRIKTFEVGDHIYNVKKFKTPNAFQSLVYRFLRKSKAKRSFEYAKILLEKGVRTPFPVAYAENFGLGLKDSYYVSIHLNYDLDFRVLNHQQKYPDRTEIVRQVAAFTFKMHEAGINFLDHSPGNTLIKKEDVGQYSFYLIDLNRMRFESMDFDARMKNFRRLWLSKTMIKIMAAEYAKLYGKTFEETHSLMTKYSRAFQKKVNSKKIRKRRRSA